jgi:hypothetical protein
MMQNLFQILMLNGLHFDTSGRVDFTTLNGDIKLFLAVQNLFQILMLNELRFDTSGRVDFTTLNGDIKLFLAVITLVKQHFITTK